MKNDTKNPAIDRVDGRMKVTGGAKYFADFELPDLAYCVIVGSEIARGTLTGIDTKKAQSAPGVLGVFTHHNMPPIPGWDAPVGGEADGPAAQARHRRNLPHSEQPKDPVRRAADCHGRGQYL
jgi:xanthine dehydrogenase YagR molybdenum-binding subunit